MENHYNDFAKRDSSTTFEFEENKITLNIPEDGELTKEGWNITPLNPTVVCLYTSMIVLMIIDTITFVLYSFVDYKEGGR